MTGAEVEGWALAWRRCWSGSVRGSPARSRLLDGADWDAEEDLDLRSELTVLSLPKSLAS